MKPNFKTMSRKELRTYVIKHPDDDEAFYAFVDRSETEGSWVKVPPLNSLEDIDNYPEFLEAVRKDREGHSEEVSIRIKTNEQQSERIFESDAIEITSDAQQGNELYGGVSPSKSRVVLRSYNDIGYQIVSEWDGSVFGTFADSLDQKFNLAEAEDWLNANGYREV